MGTRALAHFSCMVLNHNKNLQTPSCFFSYTYMYITLCIILFFNCMIVFVDYLYSSLCILSQYCINYHKNLCEKIYSCTFILVCEPEAPKIAVDIIRG